VLTRQAGGTPLGSRIRDLTLHPDTADISQRAEALLYMADRAEHVDHLVLPALEAGKHVVSDRWAFSTLVYQGYGRGLDVEELRRISDWAMHGLWPDVVLLIDVPLDIAASRQVQRDAEQDHYELAGRDLQRQVVDGYHELADADPHRWRVIDGSGSVDVVADRVWAAVSPLLERTAQHS
jgi:dTMP kinase